MDDIELNVEKRLQSFREHLPSNNIDWLDVRILGSEAMASPMFAHNSGIPPYCGGRPCPWL